MKRTLASILLLALLTAGCTGSFNLTRKVYNFHRSQSDKWADELAFLLVALTPVYGVATFADAVVFNSIEFWTGKNPIALNDSKAIQSKLVRQGNDELLVAYDPKTDQVIVTPKLNKKEKSSFLLERTDQLVLAKNDKGQVLYSSMKNDQGDVTIYNSNGNLVKNYSADEVASLKEKFLRN